MNLNQFTQKSVVAIQAAQSLAVEHGNQQIEQAHLLLALLQDDQGLVPQLLTAMGTAVSNFTENVQALVERLPKVSGGGREADKVYISQQVDQALQQAEQVRISMQDEYVSVSTCSLVCWTRPIKH